VTFSPIWQCCSRGGGTLEHVNFADSGFAVQRPRRSRNRSPMMSDGQPGSGGASDVGTTKTYECCACFSMSPRRGRQLSRGSGWAFVDGYTGSGHWSARSDYYIDKFRVWRDIWSAALQCASDSALPLAAAATPIDRARESPGRRGQLLGAQTAASSNLANVRIVIVSSSSRSGVSCANDVEIHGRERRPRCEECERASAT